MPDIKKRLPPTIRKKAAPKSSGGIESLIRGIGEEDEFLRILLYGKSGTGKTTLWGTFPAPILAIVCSGGNKTGELRSLNTPENKARIKKVTLESCEQLKQVIEYQKESRAFKTLVLDHVSGLQDLKLKEVVGIEEIPAQKHWGLASQQQYGEVSLECKTYLREMLSLACHTVIVGQERAEKDAEGSNDDLLFPFVGVDLIPSLARWLNPACDYICQTYKKPRVVNKVFTVGTGPKAKKVTKSVKVPGVDYCLRIAPHEVYTTKFRLPKGSWLPEFIVDPDYEKIVAVLDGSAKPPA